MSGIFNRGGINKGGSSQVFPEQNYTSQGSSGTGAGVAPAILDVGGMPELASGITAQEVVSILGISSDGLTAQEFVDLVNGAAGDITASIQADEIVLTFSGPIQDNELASTFVKTVDGNAPNSSGNVVSTIVVQNEDGTQASSGIQAIRFEGTAIGDPTISGSTAIFTINESTVTGFVTTGDFNAHVAEFDQLQSDFEAYETSNDAAVAAKADITYVNSQVAPKADTATTVIDADIGLDGSNEITSITVGSDVRQIAQPDISGKANTADVVTDTDVQLNSSNAITGLMVGSTLRNLASAASLDSITGSDSSEATSISGITFTTSGDDDTVVSVTDNGDGTATINLQIADDITGLIDVRDFRTGSEITRKLEAIRIQNDHDVEIQFMDGSTPYTIRTVDDLQIVNDILQATADGLAQGSGVNLRDYIEDNFPSPAIIVENGAPALNGVSANDIVELLTGAGLELDSYDLITFTVASADVTNGFYTRTDDAEFANTVIVTKNGLMQWPTIDYSISGDTITFVNPLSVGDEYLIVNSLILGGASIAVEVAGTAPTVDDIAPGTFLGTYTE